MRTIAICLLLAGCGAAQVPSEEAGASYAAQQQACVARNSTRAAIDACRAKVRDAWSTDDAGAPEAGRVLNFANDNDAGREAGK